MNSLTTWLDGLCPGAKLPATIMAIVMGLSLTCLAAEPSPWTHASLPQGPYTLESPTFPISAYSVQATDRDFTLAKNAGIGYVHWYGLGNSEDLTRAKAYLDLAQKHGLKVMFDLYGRVWIPKGEEGVEAMRRIVRQVKDHPAMGFWYLVDEPDGHFKPDELLPFYRMLKEETPHIPVTAAIHWSENWRTFVDTYDVMLNDIYPVYGRPFPEENLQHVTEFSHQALKLGKPIMPVLQMFSWGHLFKDKEGMTEYRGFPLEAMRYPKREELRYWHFSTLIQGARGMSYWSFYHGNRHNTQWVQGPFTEAAQELSRFTRMLEPVHEKNVAIRAQDDKLFVAHWKRDDQQYLVLVNAWPLKRDIRRNLTELRLGRPAWNLTPWGLTRDSEARYVNHHLIVEAQPWEVFIWQITPAQ